MLREMANASASEAEAEGIEGSASRAKRRRMNWRLILRFGKHVGCRSYVYVLTQYQHWFPPRKCGPKSIPSRTAILNLRDQAYGVTIHEKALPLVAPKSILIGAVYVTLDRLEDKGLISSLLSDPTGP